MSQCCPVDEASMPLTIVVIDDEEAHFQLIKRSIEKEMPRTNVRYFADAVSFLERVGECCPDVIVVDYLLPGMNAIEFIKALAEAGFDIPVIITTGLRNEQIASNAIELGASDYLVKSAGFFSMLPGVIQRTVRDRELKSSF